ncbi:MAG: Hydroxyacylglutathione hydrolase GloB [Pseudidiomarina mangrovi]|nr:MAG: Hydroxyacylglutathione hydrolase GloB [Pseudidiomarina mangrovi]
MKVYLAENQLQLKGILITHHHADHIGGLKQLVGDDIAVYGPVSNRIPHISQALEDGEQIHIDCLNLGFEVLHVPGHTTEHIAYYGQGMLFCGDTMFSGGCGRLFEGTPAQMHSVFQRYRELPGETKVYCTHEYTMANLAFAEHLTPENANLIEYKKWASAQREKNQPTLPSTVAQEILINPYMLTSDPEMISALLEKTGKKPSNDIESFAAIRHLKDNF